MYSVIIILCILIGINGFVTNSDETTESDGWGYKWFPSSPAPTDQNDHIRRKGELVVDETEQIQMGLPNADCDNGKDNLTIDFDPKNTSHTSMYTCLENKELFFPNESMQPIVRAYLIPPEYNPVHKCMNESIKYDYRLPTFGSHRPIWSEYGEYTFVPPQRWIHNLEHGGIVMLYHPCANTMQLDKLRTIVKQCLYRHVISASKLLEPERPFALLAWGTSIEFSIVVDNLIIEFIKTNSLQGPEKNISRNGQYNETLIEMAKIVSSNDDELLCPQNKNEN